MILTGQNAYGGTTTVSSGVLIVQNAGALPGYDTTGRVVVGTGAMLQLNIGGDNEWGAGDFTLLSTHAVLSAGAGFGFNTSDAPGGTYVSSDTASGTMSIALAAGKMVLANTANSYSGGTFLYGGTIGIDDDREWAATGGVTFKLSGTLQAQRRGYSERPAKHLR